MSKSLEEIVAEQQEQIRDLDRRLRRILPSTGDGASRIKLFDEGSFLGNIDALNFVGSGVVATIPDPTVGRVEVVTISPFSGCRIHLQDRNPATTVAAHLIDGDGLGAPGTGYFDTDGYVASSNIDRLTAPFTAYYLAGVQVGWRSLPAFDPTDHPDVSLRLLIRAANNAGTTPVGVDVAGDIVRAPPPNGQFSDAGGFAVTHCTGSVHLQQGQTLKFISKSSDASWAALQFSDTGPSQAWMFRIGD